MFSDSTKAGHKTSKGISKLKRRKIHRNTSEKRRAAKEREFNEKFLRNLSTHQLSDDQVNVLSRGLKFIPTPVTNKTFIRRQLLRDFDNLQEECASNTVLCKCNANVFHWNSQLFLAFWRKNTKFSMEANFQRKVTVIHDAYCFQLREFSNNSRGTKIDFDFSRENLFCSINDFDHLRIFRTIICSVWICRDGSLLVSLQCVSFTTNLCPFI